MKIICHTGEEKPFTCSLCKKPSVAYCLICREYFCESCQKAHTEAFDQTIYEETK